jgi:hypothetical protein
MDKEQLIALLKEDVPGWNTWWKVNVEIQPDLRLVELHGADLSGANLSEADLSGANLSEADLSGANLIGAILSEAHVRKAKLPRANLTGANLSGANLSRANLSNTKLVGANLSGANLSRANLFGSDLSRADLSGANLSGASLVHARLTDADLTACRVFGVSAWEVQLMGAKQQSLVITEEGAGDITVDNLEVAQFIYLLLNNQKIRGVIDTITSKAVLILGRFTEERKRVLDALREELRRHNYLPILFDFDKPASRNFTETVSTLAHMARFVIADITDPRSIPQELKHIVPALPAVPIQPLLHSADREWGMFTDFFDFPTVLPPHRYDTLEELLASVPTHVIAPAEQKAKEIAERRAALEQQLRGGA